MANTKFNNWALDLIYEKLSLETLQEFILDKDTVMNNLLTLVKMNRARILADKENGVVIYALYQSPIVAEIWIFSSSKSYKKLIAGSKRLQEWGWRNTAFEKVQLTTHEKKVGRLAETLGFKLEGVREKSFLTKDGKIINQFMYGIKRP